MTTRYCTLFDHRYLTRGVTMISSLLPYLHEDDEVIALALDDVAAEALAKLKLAKTRVVRLTALGDAELLELQRTRPHREFCWTCTPALSAAMVRAAPDGDTVVYVDADLLFFSDPKILLDELGHDGAILIHEHRFSPAKANLIENGRFNVGFVAFRCSPEARDCVTRWRAQTIDCCKLDPKNGYCGDQRYLDEWPSLYPGLRILRNLGGGVAPWNVSQYKVERRGSLPFVDGEPIVFYHYHALQTIATGAHEFVAINPAAGYRFSMAVLEAIYRPYSALIRDTKKMVAETGTSVMSDRTMKSLLLKFGVGLRRLVPVVQADSTQ